jgi:hypothetical protein
VLPTSTVWQRGWVTMGVGKGEHGGLGGGGLRPTQRGCRQPKSGRQTFTRKGRLRQMGREDNQKRHCRLCLLNDNNYNTLGLWYRPQCVFLNSGLRERISLRRNGPLWFMVSTNNGDRGKVGGLKKTNSLALTGP